MKQRFGMMFLALLLALTAIPAMANPAGEITDKTAKKIRKELVTLPFYSVFDNMAFKVEDGIVTLYGQVTRPTLRKDAQRVVERIDGVEQVVNKIEVLPLSNFDDRIRIAVFRAIYRQPGFDRLAVMAVPPIHIIVKNGNVTLKGVVANEGEANFANVRANSVPGVFEVRNELRVESASRER